MRAYISRVSTPSLVGVQPMQLAYFWKELPVYFCSYYIDEDGQKKYLFKFRARSTIGEHLPLDPPER